MPLTSALDSYELKKSTSFRFAINDVVTDENPPCMNKNGPYWKIARRVRKYRPRAVSLDSKRFRPFVPPLYARLLGSTAL